MTASVREPTAADREAVRTVQRAAFGRDAEAALVDALIDSGAAILGLVAAENGIVVGHVLFSKLALTRDDDAVDISAAALAPVAVVPDRQRRGIGTLLIREGLRRLTGRGVSVAIVLGDPAYYERFGFSSLLTRSIRGPFSGASWMALELAPNALAGFQGRARYAAAFEPMR